MSEKEKNRWLTKNRLLSAKLIVVLLVAVVLFSFASVRNEKRLLISSVVKFENPEHPLISEETVNKLLIQNKGSVKNIRKLALDLNKLETELDSNPYVRNANLYVSVNGEVGVSVLQKKPLARVQTNKTFYIDEEGDLMPISPNFSVRVPLVTGNVNKKNLKEVYTVVKNINQDSFFKKEIEGVIVKNNTFTLLTREFDFVIDLGSSENIKMKLKNFKAFYEKALKDRTLKKYKRVNLQIATQVICTKK